jgi:hypothetical protein
MVALLIAGLRYAASAPRRSRAPGETPGNYAGVLRSADRPWCTPSGGTDSTCGRWEPAPTRDTTDHWGFRPSDSAEDTIRNCSSSNTISNQRAAREPVVEVLAEADPRCELRPVLQVEDRGDHSPPCRLVDRRRGAGAPRRLLVVLGAERHSPGLLGLEAQAAERPSASRRAAQAADPRGLQGVGPDVLGAAAVSGPPLFGPSGVWWSLHLRGRRTARTSQSLDGTRARARLAHVVRTDTNFVPILYPSELIQRDRA